MSHCLKEHDQPFQLSRELEAEALRLALRLTHAAGQAARGPRAPERALESPHIDNEATLRILGLVERRTGAPVYLLADPSLTGFESANVRFADEKVPVHAIRLDPYYSGFLNHLVAHECAHIIRWSAAAPSERLLPTLTPETLRRARRTLEPHRSRLVEEGIPEEWITDLFDFWIRGLVTQVTNIPADIRIERWLHRQFPQLRHIQARSLTVQLREYRMALAPQVQEVTPPPLFLASNAVNYAYAAEVGPLIGQAEATDIYSESGARDLGDKLRHALGPVRPGHQGHDRETADRWARILGIRGWYKWTAR